MHEPGKLFETDCDFVIQGLAYHQGFWTVAECDSLLDLLSRQPWDTRFKRRVQQYGYAYQYQRTRGVAAKRADALPDWLQATADAVQPFFESEETVRQVIVNEYEPGQGIGSHIDDPECFGETIAVLSLGSDVVMDFTQQNSSRKRSLRLEPGGLLILQGDSRYEWKHGIASRKTDRIDGRKIPRGRRVSLTFRDVRNPERQEPTRR